MNGSSFNMDLPVPMKKPRYSMEFDDVDDSRKHPLLIPEILVELFRNFDPATDFETLKNFRMVCSVWKSCVFQVLKEKRVFLPVSTTDSLREASKCPQFLCRSISSTTSTLKPMSELPIKLTICKWSDEIANFLTKFRTSIVFLGLHTSDFDSISQKTSFPCLSNMQHTKFTGELTSSSTKNFLVSLGLWKKLTNVPQKLKTRYIELHINSNILPTDPTLDIVPWDLVRMIQCDLSFYNQLTLCRNLRGLKILKLLYNVPLTRSAHAIFPQTQLEELAITSKGLFKVYHQPQLSTITLIGAALRSVEPLPDLLPMLTRVRILDIFRDSIHFPCLTTRHTFQNVNELDLLEARKILNLDEIKERTQRIRTIFPNLKTLKWHSAGNARRRFTNKNCLLAAPVIFCKMETLTSLHLAFVRSTSKELFKIITGIHHQRIPVDERNWPVSVNTRKESICNLKQLKVFELVQDEEKLVFGYRKTQFLFRAAFHSMEMLEVISFKNIDLLDKSCIETWRNVLGKQIILL